MNDFKKTGAIWNLSSRKRRYIVRRICESLINGYGTPRHSNPEEILDDLIFIILSNKTAPEIAKNVFTKLKLQFKLWDLISDDSLNKLKMILKPGGLSNIKSKQILSIIKIIKKDFGNANLNNFRDKSVTETERYLVSLPGVSKKVAKCVMMYTLSYKVLPVDSHVFRIAKRLGWTERSRADQCHEELENLVPPNKRYAFHVDCISHGRNICRSRKPLCSYCFLKEYCNYYKNRDNAQN